MGTKPISEMSVLVIDDNHDELKAIQSALVRYGFTHKVDTLAIENLHDLNEKIIEKYQDYDILFFDLTYENSAEEGIKQLEALITTEEQIMLTAVYILSASDSEVLNGKSKVNALIIDFIKKPTSSTNITDLVATFNAHHIKEVVQPFVSKYAYIKESMNITQKIDMHMDSFTSKVDYLMSANKIILSLLPDTMDKRKRQKAIRYIEDNIANIEFPENLKRNGIFEVVKDVVIESFKDGFKETSIEVFKENFFPILKEALLSKTAEDGYDAETILQAGIYLARNSMFDLLKVASIDLEEIFPA